MSIQGEPGVHERKKRRRRDSEDSQVTSARALDHQPASTSTGRRSGSRASKAARWTSPDPDSAHDTIKYPCSPWLDVLGSQQAVPVKEVDFLELSRSFLLSRPSSSNGHFEATSDEIAKAIEAGVLSLQTSDSKVWQRDLRRVLRTHLCFIPRFDRKTRSRYYWCDSSIEPQLQKGQTADLAQGALDLAGTRRHATHQDDLDPDHNVPSSEDEGLELESSPIFEVRLAEGVVLYCMKCGPHIARRVRKDGRCYLSPLLHLVRILKGPVAKKEALELVSQSLGGGPNTSVDIQGKPKTIPLHVARLLASNFGLLDSLSEFLSDALPPLADTDPITRAVPETIAKPHLTCFYCGQMCRSAGHLQRHLSRRAGTCQVQHPRHLSAYRKLLTKLLRETQQEVEEAQTSDSEGSGPTGMEEPAQDEPLYGSSIPPNLSFWTRNEKEAFFRALQRFSRFRPDAIAEAIGTKSIGDVEILMSDLESCRALDATYRPRELSRHPAAREMSEKWISFEETLAEDAIVWEAFLSEAGRTSPDLRDLAQGAALDDATRPQCRQCHRGTCDGKWPTCKECSQNGDVCEWDQDYHPQILVNDLDATVRQLGEGLVGARDTKNKASARQAVRKNVLDSLSWEQVVVLGYQQKARLRSLEKGAVSHALSDSQIGKSLGGQSLREKVATSMKQADLGQIPARNDGGVLREVEQDRRRGGGVDIQDSEGTKSRRGHSGEEKDKKPARSSAKRSARWAELALRNVQGTPWAGREGSKGVGMEMELAARQLKMTGITLDSLDPGLDVFNLKRLGKLLDLFRYGTAVEARVSRGALHALLDDLRSYVTSIVACTVCILDAIGSDHPPKKKAIKAALLDAIRMKAVKADTSSELVGGRRSTTAQDRLLATARRLTRTTPTTCILDEATDRADSAGARDSFGHLSNVFEVRSEDHYNQSIRHDFECDSLDVWLLDGDDSDLGETDDEDNLEASVSELEIDSDDDDDLEQREQRQSEKDQLEDVFYEERMWRLLKNEESRSDGEAANAGGGWQSDDGGASDLEDDRNEERGASSGEGDAPENSIIASLVTLEDDDDDSSGEEA